MRNATLEKNAIDFLRQMVTPNGEICRKKNIFSDKLKFPCSNKVVEHFIGFLKYYQNYKLRIAEKLNSLFQLQQTTDDKHKIIITPELQSKLSRIFDFLDNCSSLTFRQLLLDKKWILVTATRFQVAQNAMWAKVDPNQRFSSTYKTINMTDIKSVQAKLIPTTLWNAYDLVLRKKFTSSQILGKMNSTAKFHFRLEAYPIEKKYSGKPEVVPLIPNEVNFEVPGISLTDQIC